MPREFHISDVLTITTGRFVSIRRMEGVYDILNYLTADNLFTHQIPRAMRECAPVLLARHPELAAADPEGMTAENHTEYLARWVSQFGETMTIWPLADGQHERIDPIAELSEMVDPSRIIPVVVQEQEP